MDFVNHSALTDVSAIAASIASTIHGEKPSSRKTKQKYPNPVDRLTVCAPGNYCLTLKFTGFEVRTKAELKNNWVLSFWHPPLGVTKEDRCKLVAKSKGSQDGNSINKFEFDKDEHEVWEFLIPKISSEILETPLKVYFFQEGQKLDSEPIAFSHIPLGDIFVAEVSV